MELVVTHISAAAASLTWALYERIRHGKASMVGLVTGTIAGLASMTPASGFIGPLSGLIIGAVAGVLCQIAVNLVKERLRTDDTVDVFAVHGIGGIFGTLMAPILAVGALEGGQWIITQLIALAAVGAFMVVVSAVLVKLTGLVYPIRVSEENEFEGLDITAHGERGYDLVS